MLNQFIDNIIVVDHYDSDGETQNKQFAIDSALASILQNDVKFSDKKVELLDSITAGSDGARMMRSIEIQRYAFGSFVETVYEGKYTEVTDEIMNGFLWDSIGNVEA